MKLKLVIIVVACLGQLTASAVSCPRPLPRQIMGKVIIPKIHVDVSVKEGTADDAAVPGPYPVHYRRTALPGEGGTVVISGHHFTHPLPGARGGVFLHLDQLRRGDSIYLTLRRRFGKGNYRYVVTSNRTVDCGYTVAGFKYCKRALTLMKRFNQDKLYLVTCEGAGYERQVVTAFAA